jgi:hypothetical protein
LRHIGVDMESRIKKLSTIQVKVITALVELGLRTG